MKSLENLIQQVSGVVDLPPDVNDFSSATFGLMVPQTSTVAFVTFPGGSKQEDL